jgi:myo-inositol 2-dehydrogenase / D-chiro-inositol 1-dehydrogenase
VDVTAETTFIGLDAYQKVIDSGVDMVILATSPGFRPYHIEAAVKAKKHIFCEKPVATDGPGIRKCLELVEEAKKANIAIVAGTQRRHQKGYIETVKALHDGEIGEITSGRCYWNGTEPWFRERQKGMTDMAYQLSNWYHFCWVGGDHITEQHVHNLDVMNWVMKTHPISAVGMGGRSHRKSGPANEVGNIFDHFAVEYEYPNGVHMFSYCRHAPGCVQDVSESVTGTKGSVSVNGYRSKTKKLGTDDDISPYVQEHIDMIKSIRDGKPLNELQAVTESTMTAILGRMATYSGEKITWDEGVNSKVQLMPTQDKLTWDAKLETDPVPLPGKGRKRIV